MTPTGRPREFDEDEVVATATDLFWRNGLRPTSIEQVVTATGVGRQSLYGAFGDKHGLFLRALRNYIDHGPGVVAPLATGPVLPGLRTVLLGALSQACANPGRGCMLGNTAAELAPADEEAAALVAKAFAALEQAVATALARAQESGEVRSDAAPADQAAMVIAFLQGMQLMSRVTDDPMRFAGAVDGLLAGLQAP